MANSGVMSSRNSLDIKITNCARSPNAPCQTRTLANYLCPEIIPD